MGFIMAKCRNCKIEILDETEYCPLCHSILDQTESLENMYPNIRPIMKKQVLFRRIYLFFAIVLESILFGINYLHSDRYEIWWSAITGLGLLYVYVVLRYAILGEAGHKGKVLLLSSIAVLSAVAIDLITGYQGWSVDYVVPAGILLVDGIILICMYVNRRNWQSYIMWQILMIFLSLIPIGLYHKGLEHNEILAFSPMSLSVAIFLGTMIIGDRRARVELKRRFHIN